MPGRLAHSVDDLVYHRPCSYKQIDISLTRGAQGLSVTLGIFASSVSRGMRR